MQTMRRCAVLLLVGTLSAFGKSPADTSSVCDRYKNSDVIFTGTAETQWITMVDTLRSPVHKRSEKSKRVRFLVREWYKGKRSNTVEIWLTPSDCPLQIEADQTYLIYARADKDKGRMESNACMGTALASAAAADLTFIDAASRGPGLGTEITGSAGAEGLTVQAKSGMAVRYAASGAGGKFVFDGLAPGDWALSVNGGAARRVVLEPNSCVAAPAF
jgi:hypothetical protein